MSDKLIKLESVFESANPLLGESFNTNEDKETSSVLSEYELKNDVAVACVREGGATRYVGKNFDNEDLSEENNPKDMLLYTKFTIAAHMSKLLPDYDNKMLKITLKRDDKETVLVGNLKKDYVVIFEGKSGKASKAAEEEFPTVEQYKGEKPSKEIFTATEYGLPIGENEKKYSFNPLRMAGLISGSMIEGYNELNLGKYSLKHEVKGGENVNVLYGTS